MDDNQLDKGHWALLLCFRSKDGGVAEWSKAAVLKTVVPQGTVGSNPTSSAFRTSYERSELLVLKP